MLGLPGIGTHVRASRIVERGAECYRVGLEASNGGGAVYGVCSSLPSPDVSMCENDGDEAATSDDRIPA